MLHENKKVELTAEELAEASGGKMDFDVVVCPKCGARVVIYPGCKDHVCGKPPDSGQNPSDPPLDPTWVICASCGKTMPAGLIIDGICAGCRSKNTAPPVIPQF